MKLQRKKLLGLGALVLAAALVIGAIVFITHEKNLLQQQNEALAELERNAGHYDDQSIVLSNTSRARAEELAALYGAKLRITDDGRFATLTLPEGMTIRDAYAMDESRGHILEMSADYHVSASDLETEEEVPDELPQIMRPRYNATDTDYALQTYLDYLNMRDVWNSYTGRNVAIAVIDTGIDTDHPEFANRISPYSYNATEDKIVKDHYGEDGNYDWSLIEDTQGHGTSVAGVLAASMNSDNIIGIAPNAQILVIKAECREDGTFERTSDLVFGLYYAIERDVQVVNMSFGSPLAIDFEKDPFYAPTKLAYDSDIICVAAAGNEGTSGLMSPACHEYVIGVGAIDENWTLADYSNYGENVNVVAPGTTYTTMIGGGYGTQTGTSFSSPMVAGAVALFMQGNRYATFDLVQEVLYASSYDLGAPGMDWDYGYGALDISAFILEKRGTIIFDMLTDEVKDLERIYIHGHGLQVLPEPERLYAVFDGWYYDDTFTQEVDFTDRYYEDITVYAKWVNEDDGLPYTYVVLDDGTVEVRSYTGHRRYITIPDKIDGRTVSSIGDFAFADQTKLRGVTLPSGLTKIGRYAFQNCSNLLSIQIPAGVTSIGEGAFKSNIRLSSVAFLGTSKLETINESTFENCAKLQKFEIPASLRDLDPTAFLATTSLHTVTVQTGNTAFKSVDGVLFNMTGSSLLLYPAAHGSSYAVPDGTMTIGNYAFAYAKIQSIDLNRIQVIGRSAFYCSGLKTLNIPDSVITMGGGAFSGNYNLSQLTIGSGLTNISDTAFYGTGSLKSVTIPSNIETIGQKAFEKSGLQTLTFAEGSTLKVIGGTAFGKCYLREIAIPKSVNTIRGSAFIENIYMEAVLFTEDSELIEIGDDAFSSNLSLSYIKLPKKLQKIGDGAFSACNLTEITIPASVTQLGYGAFANNSLLTYITVEEGNTVYHDVDGVVHNHSNTELYAFPSGRELSSYTILSTVRNVMPNAFSGTYKLGKVIVPEGMTEIGDYAFAGCGASTYTLPSTLTRIGDSAFSGNTNLKNITLPSALTTIEQYAFSDCTSLRSIRIPDNVTKIGRYAFKNDYALSYITFNSTSKMDRIGMYAFAYCGLYEFTVPSNVSSIAQFVFEGCRSLYKITFAENSKLEYIPAYTFIGCENLNSIVFKEGSALTSIQAHGMEGLTRLASVDFGDAKLTNIDNFAFRFCECLTTLELPETLTNIGRYAFYGCSELTKLVLPMDLEHIGSYAFLGAEDLELYFMNEQLPEYLDENWDRSIRGYYLGIVSIEENEEYRYAVLSSGGIAILEYKGEETTVDLSKVDLGGPIYQIGGGAFRNSTVRSVILPDTLKSILAEAFRNSSLESVVIPDNVTFIGREAFAYTDIREVTFSGTSKLSVIEQYAFSGAKNLQTITIPASVTTMGTGVFMGSGLTEVFFAEGIRLSEIPARAFAETKLTAIHLPDSVTLVDDNAFNNVQTLKEVTFGSNDGIRLMSNAFYHTGLESLHIPANVTYIGEYCFVGLFDLQEFQVDPENPNYCAIDGLLLSKDGRKLIAVPAGKTGSLTVPASVEQLGFGTFEESKLSEVIFLPDTNILTIGIRAFYKASNLTTITIPASVVSIDYYAFAYCDKLESVIFAEGNQMKGIYEGAFLGDGKLKNIVLPDTIVEVSDFAFYGCAALDRLPVSDTAQLLGVYNYAFAYTGLRGEFTVPATLLDIGDYAFMGTDITKLTIPNTNAWDLMIGLGAFEGCDGLTEVTLPFIGAGFDDEEISWFGYIFGAGSYEANAAYVPQSIHTVTINGNTTTIGTGAFYGLTNLQQIHVPDSVCYVSQYAFDGTSASYTLTNTIYVNRFTVCTFGTGICGVLKLGEGAEDISGFENCVNLTEVVLPEYVYKIHDKAFAGSGIQRLSIPDGTIIGDRIVDNCLSLESVYVGKDVNLSLYFGQFYNCPSLKRIDVSEENSLYLSHDGILYNRSDLSTAVVPEAISGTITIPEGILEIKANAFARRTQLEEIILPDSLTKIAGRAFYGCSSLKSIRIGASVNTIGGAVFSGCTSLEQVHINDLGAWCNIYYDVGNDNVADGYPLYQAQLYLNGELLTHAQIPDGITQISDHAFNNCKSLQSVTIPNSVIFIGNAAFGGCDALTQVTMGNNVSTIGTGAFNGCIKLTDFTITPGVTYIGSSAFYGCTALNQITNLSTLYITPGSSGNGFVAYYASAVTDANGNKYYKGYNGALGMETADGFVYSIDSGYYFLTGYVGDMEVVTLPTDIDGHKYFVKNFRGAKHVIIPEGMTMVDPSAFSGNTLLETVTLPSTITTIGNNAFYECVNLRQINLPDGLEVIESKAFYKCEALKYLEIPDSVTTLGTGAFKYSGVEEVKLPAGLTRISSELFSGSSLRKITIPASVQTIEEGAFGWSDLEEIEIPNGVTTIMKGAFEASGLKRVVIADSVTQIGESAFEHCTNLTTVVLPSNLTVLEKNVFYYCTSLKGIVIPETVTSIGAYAFYCPRSLVELTIPASVTTIGDYAFYDANELCSVTFNEGLQTIGNYAFDGSEKLTSVELPGSVTQLGANAFYKACDITFVGDNAAFRVVDGILYDATSMVSIVGELPAVIRVPEGITQIPASFFEGNAEILQIILPNSVTEIGDYAFRNCTGLTSVSFGSGLAHIGYRAFEGCTGLQEVHTPSVTAWLHISFGQDGNPLRYAGHLYVAGELLKDLVIPEEITLIGYNAFEGATCLETVRMHDKVTYVASNVFDGCTNLKEVVLPDILTRIYTGTFQDCRSLETINMPSRLLQIENEAFRSCNALKQIILPEKLQTIGEYSFAHCNALEYVYIPASVTSIHNRSFYNCKSLKQIEVAEGNQNYFTQDGILYNNPVTDIILIPQMLTGDITIPEGITTIDGSEFSDIEYITSITLPDSLVEIGTYGIFHCDGLKEIHIGSGLCVLNSNALMNNRALERVKVDEENPYFLSIDGVLYDRNISQIILAPMMISGDITIPSGLTVINDRTFFGCVNLRSVTIPEGVVTIGSNAFYGCEGLIEVNLPNSLNFISNYAFYGCVSLSSVTIPSAVDYIGNYAFFGCEVLHEVTNLSNLVFTIGSTGHGYIAYYAESLTDKDGNVTYRDSSISYVYTDDGFVFQIQDGKYTLVAYRGDKENITLPDSINGSTYSILRFRGGVHVTIPESITQIGDYAFAGNSTIRSITIPESVKLIGTYAFRNCSQLSDVSIIGKGLETVLSNAFSGANISRVNITDLSHWFEINFSSVPNTGSVIIHPQNTANPLSQQADLYVNGELLTELVVPNGVTNIHYSLFSGCTSIQTVVIPGSVREIGEYAFYRCYNLKTVSVEKGLTTILDNAFCECTALTNLTLPEGLLTIGNNAFMGCEKLAQIDIPTTVTALGASAFRGCTSLQTLVIPDCVVTIWSGVLSGCTGLTSVKLPEHMTVIPSSMFNDCTSLAQIEIPDQVVQIGSAAFKNCIMLKEIVLPQTVKTIGYDAFSGCTSLSSIYLYEGITEIGSGAFAGCISLKQIQLPDSLTYLDSAVFDESGIYDNPEYWIEGSMVIDGWLIKLDPNTVYMPHEKYKGALEDAYEDCQYLKNALWGGSIEGTTNVETIIVPHLTYNSIPSGLTLKNIVILDTVELTEFYNYRRFLENVTGVTIFVDALEDDMRLDDNFDNWNNGNKVYYRDQWHWVHFYDENGNLLISEPIPNAQVIRLPIYRLSSDAYFTYGLIGWDVDGDGIADNIPATTIVDVSAHAVVRKTQRTYTITFADELTGEVYFSLYLPYNAMIPAMENPVKTGYSFVTWSGLNKDFCVTSDHTFYAVWVHEGYDHVYAEPVWVDATCEEGGHYVHVCTVCGEVLKTDMTEPLGHNYKHQTVAPTCTQEGYTIHQCDRCDASYTDSYTDMTEHAYGQWIQDTAAGCATEGKCHRKCVDCGHVQHEVIAPNGHTFVSKTLREPTCEEEGLRQWTCQTCGHTVNEAIEKLPHKYIDLSMSFEYIIELQSLPVQVPYGMHADGAYCYGCEDCHQLMMFANEQTGSGVQSACNHTNANWEVLYPVSCGKVGIECLRCPDCGEILSLRALPALEHHYVAVVTPPTCTQPGYTTHTCENCGDSYRDSEVPAHGHEFGQWYEFKAADCTNDGELRRDCVHCDFYESEVVTALSHDWDDGVVQTAPTEESDGCMLYTCERCHATKTQIIPALQHQHSYTSVVTAPTCTTGGYTTHSCRCGHSYVDSLVDPLGHKYGNWYTTDAPTCTDSGEERRDCERCDHFETRTVAAKGHTYKDTVTAPTCTERGYTTHTCHCGHSYVDSYKNALGHKYTNYVSDGNATETKDGTKTAVCDHGCGTTHTVTDEGSMLGSKEITSDKFTVKDDFISKIKVGTTVAQIKDGIKETNIKILQGGKEVSNTALAGTGMVVQLISNGKVVDEVTVVVTGDTNGDGKITVTDMIAVKSHILKKSTLTGAAAKAADSSSDNAISITDFIQIKAHILGKSQVTPASAKHQQPNKVQPELTAAKSKSDPEKEVATIQIRSVEFCVLGKTASPDTRNRWHKRTILAYKKDLRLMPEIFCALQYFTEMFS